MDHEALVARIAPCGLDCGKCLSYPGSPINTLSIELRRELGGFGQRAAFFTALDPVFADYPGFERVLDRLGAATCSGCRSGSCLLGDCRVKDCVKAKGVDFCFECPAFPCADTGFPEPLASRWRSNNERMRDMGLPAYFEFVKDKPRY